VISLDILHLSKRYKDILAINDISFSINKGDFYAFLGPNGAGKSTTIKIIAKLLSDYEGSVTLDNNSNDDFIRSKIGVVFQDNVLDGLLTVKENLLYRGALYIKDKKKLIERYEELKEYLHFADFENQKFKTLSGGQKRRVEIARALFSNPELLILDEPTTGLDPETRRFVWECINDLKINKGLTILLTTHYMEEASNCDVVTIINKGQIIVTGTPSELKHKYSFDRIKIVPFEENELEKALKELGLSFKKVVDEYIIVVNSTQETITVIKQLELLIKQFEVIKGNMDDVFLNVIGEIND
jgi:multidrug/hemolysin transport system ATP-binding protein